MRKNFKQLLEELSTNKIGKWEIKHTNRIGDRKGRIQNVPDGHWDLFHKRVIANIEHRTQKPYKDGEYMVHSPSLGDPKNPGMKVVVNLRQNPAQIRHITHLEKNMVAKAGTPTIKVESIEQELPVIEIE